jgi:hypothetical protein
MPKEARDSAVQLGRLPRLPRSEIVVFVRGEQVFVQEWYSQGMTKRIMKQVEADIGLIFHELCQGMCG